MGFWISIARPAGTLAPDRQAVIACLDRQEWLHPFDPPEDVRYFLDLGFIQLEEEPSSRYAAPYLSARLSWGGSEEEAREAFAHLHTLAGELGMAVHGIEPLVPLDAEGAVTEHQSGRRAVVGLFGTTGRGRAAPADGEA